LLLLAGLATVACTPSLNWRDVQLGRLSTLLPCKPDTATRSVTLSGQAVTMEMAGCEADAALFAISHIQADDAAQATQLMAALRTASLAQVQTLALHPQTSTGDAQTSLDVLVDGKRPDGSALQARFKWVLAGSEVYQIAAYAEHLRTEHLEPLLSEVRIR
jgi:hypothetical protein